MADGRAATTARAGIGQSVRRHEDERFLTGRGRFGDDLNLPVQAAAWLLRSPHAHAKIVAVDTTKASVAPGVVAVLTAADYLADGMRAMPHAPTSQSPPDITLVNTDGVPPVAPHQMPLAHDRVRFVGEAVALVIAETLAAAKDAAELVEVEYRPLPAVASATAACAPDAPLLGHKPESNVTVDALVGDGRAAEAAFGRAAHVARLATHVQRVTGVPMEPRTALAEYDPATGRHTLYIGGGSVGRARRDVAQMLAVSEAELRVIAYDVGGNYGTRNGTYPEFALACWAAKRLGRPVKWRCERGEALLTDFHGRDLTVEAELALDATGNFVAFRTSNLSNLGAYAASFVPLTKGTELSTSLYRTPVAHARARAVFSNTVSTAPYRSAGRPEVMFVKERLIDIAARQGGFDRVALRRSNLIPEAALPYTNPFGMTYDSGAYEAILDRTLALADWDGFAARRAEARARGRYRGIGLGTYVESQSGAPNEEAVVTVRSEGVVEVEIGTLSTGQGHETSYPQLLADWLGVENDRVRIRTGDTDRHRFGAGSHSGRSIRLASITMHAASQRIIEKGLQIAAHLLEAAEADIAFAGCRFVVRGTDRAVDLFAVAGAAERDLTLPEALRGPLAGSGDVVSRISSFPHGWHVAEVEVDPETGAVELARYTAIDDVGRAVNPMIIHGQTHGGIAQGMGQALMEHCVYDPESSQALAGSFMDYAMPRAGDLPFFTTDLSEVPSTTHPLGFRGGGEGGITPALGVIINAVVDALSDFGVTHIEMPATPEKVWRAMREGRGSEASTRRAS
ncbi:MAG TPA: xanthine dehydrogenase family protein molybdopterin-binding subunit [Stellaceae bacterium]|jgi:carbon-monoxide dehydrogenase large subunit|nr:xanthine dehydrogenase family protein molybdopterin-binding subunit [Stellaceae bacterium]